MPVVIDGTTGVTAAAVDANLNATQLASGNAPAARITNALNATGDAPIFACRAWVNFNGTRNVTDTGASTNGQPVFIRASGNVTSVVKNAAGDYTVNFTTAMPDANYVTSCTIQAVGGGAITAAQAAATTPTTDSVRVLSLTTTGGLGDTPFYHIAIFR